MNQVELFDDELLMFLLQKSNDEDNLINEKLTKLIKIETINNENLKLLIVKPNYIMLCETTYIIKNYFICKIYGLTNEYIYGKNALDYSDENNLICRSDSNKKLCIELLEKYNERYNIIYSILGLISK